VPRVLRRTDGLLKVGVNRYRRGTGAAAPADLPSASMLRARRWPELPHPFLHRAALRAIGLRCVAVGQLGISPPKRTGAGLLVRPVPRTNPMRRRSFTPSRTHGPLRCASQQRLHPTRPPPTPPVPKTGDKPAPGPCRSRRGRKDSAVPGSNGPLGRGRSVGRTADDNPPPTLGLPTAAAKRHARLTTGQGRATSR